jgi:uncharacterized membrane protein YidH (DUF202 family)
MKVLLHVTSDLLTRFAALERTFLGYLRTSLALSMIGVTVAQLFRLQHNPNPNPIFGFYVLGKPLACICQAAAIYCLILGAYRTWRIQAAMVRGKAISGGIEIVLLGLGIFIVGLDVQPIYDISTDLFPDYNDVFCPADRYRYHQRILGDTVDCTCTDSLDKNSPSSEFIQSFNQQRMLSLPTSEPDEPYRERLGDVSEPNKCWYLHTSGGLKEVQTGHPGRKPPVETHTKKMNNFKPVVRCNGAGWATCNSFQDTNMFLAFSVSRFLRMCKAHVLDSA